MPAVMGGAARTMKQQRHFHVKLQCNKGRGHALCKIAQFAHMLASDTILRVSLSEIFQALATQATPAAGACLARFRNYPMLQKVPNEMPIGNSRIGTSGLVNQHSLKSYLSILEVG
jgi:hypothetical protein